MNSNQDLLDTFRSDWIKEVNQKLHQESHLLPSTSTHYSDTTNTSNHQPNLSGSIAQPTHPSNNQHRHACNHLQPLSETFNQSDTSLGLVNKITSEPQEFRSPVSTYAHAVHYEKLGLLDDALRMYRLAFKADPKVDHRYHRLKPQELEAMEKQFYGSQESTQDSKPTATPLAHATDSSDPNLTFKFSRPIQTDEDYQMKGSSSNSTGLPKSHPIILAATDGSQNSSVHRELTRLPSTRSEAFHDVPDPGLDSHPSSTRRLMRDLLESFEAYPWVRPTPMLSDDQAENEPEKSSCDDDRTQISSGSPESQRPPRQSDILATQDLLSDLSLDAPLIPIKYIKPAESTRTTVEQNWFPIFEALDPTQPCQPSRLPLELILYILRLFLTSSTTTSLHSQVILIERFALVSRLARLLTLDEHLWRSICEETYRSKFVKDQADLEVRNSNDPIFCACQRWHGADWRRMYIEE